MIIKTTLNKDINNTKINKEYVENVWNMNNSRFKFNRIFLLLILHLIIIVILLFLLLDMLFSNKKYFLCNFMNEIAIWIYIFLNFILLIILYLHLENINEKDLNNLEKFKKILFLLKILPFLIFFSKYLPSHCCLSFKNDFYYYLSIIHILLETFSLNLYFWKIKNDIRNASQFLSQYK